MGDALDLQPVASILAAAAYARAASALIAGFEDCDARQRLLEEQKSTLLEQLVAQFEGLEAEFVQLLDAARELAPSLVEDLEGVARTRARLEP